MGLMEELRTMEEIAKVVQEEREEIDATIGAVEYLTKLAKSDLEKGRSKLAMVRLRAIKRII